MEEREVFILRMITENRIDGLLAVTKRDLNGEEWLYYQINGMTCLKELYARRQMHKGELATLLNAILNVLRQLNDYLLEGDCLMLSPEYIFASSHDDSILFCLYPCVKTEFRTQIRLLAEYFLEHIDHEEEQVVNIAYRFYRMTRDENFEYSRIVEEIAQKSNEQEWKSDEKKDKEKTAALDQSMTAENDSAFPVPGKRNDVEDQEDDFASLPPLKEKREEGKLMMCLSAGSLIFCLFTCTLKRYLYGCSFSQLFVMKEVWVSMALFAVFLAGTIWRGAASITKDKKLPFTAQ